MLILRLCLDLGFELSLLRKKRFFWTSGFGLYMDLSRFEVQLFFFFLLLLFSLVWCLERDFVDWCKVLMIRGFTILCKIVQFSREMTCCFGRSMIFLVIWNVIIIIILLLLTVLRCYQWESTNVLCIFHGEFMWYYYCCWCWLLLLSAIDW